MSNIADQLRRALNPTWSDIILGLVANLLQLVVRYVAVGAAFHFGWRLIGG